MSGHEDVIAGAEPGRTTTRPVDLAGLLGLQRDGCRETGSELYARVLQRAIDRADSPGPIRDLLTPHTADRFGTALALRFLGAVHRIVLEGRAPELAAHYPSVGGTPGADLEDVFERTVRACSDELATHIDDGVQTNEVGRSATLVGAYLLAARSGLPLRMLEIGTSAGLNLRWDKYHYEAGGSAFGDPRSPVRFVEPWVDAHPALDTPATVIERSGCDRAPIDPTTDEGRLRLQSFVWPDQVTRFQRLDAAIEVARGAPVDVERAEATTWLADRLAEPAEGRMTIVTHSIVMQYLGADGRRTLTDTLEQAGARATRDAPLSWVRMEPGHESAETRRTTWPGGRSELVATSSYHGPPVRWLV